MRKIISATLLTIATFVTHNISAEEPLIIANEYERLIVNWSPTKKHLATILAYECASCSPQRLQVNQNTELVSEYGEQLPIEHLKSKVDWAGTIQTLDSNNLEIIRIMLH